MKQQTHRPTKRALTAKKHEKVDDNVTDVCFNNIHSCM